MVRSIGTATRRRSTRTSVMRTLVGQPILWLAVVMLVLAGTSDAEIYKSLEPNGTIGYSDRPNANAERLLLPPLSVIKGVEITPQTPPAPSTDPVSEAAYQRFRILRPEDGETLRANGGDLSIEFDVTPALDPTHAIVVHFDRQPRSGEPGNPILTLTDADRGPHSFEGLIVDATGRELARSSSVTVHVQRVSVLTTRIH